MADSVAGTEADLSQDERERADRFATPALRARFVSAHVGLRNILAHYVGAPAAQLSFAVGPFGKPELQGGAGIRFNLSHSAELAACVVSQRDHAVGIDIERRGRIDDLPGLAALVFSETERAQLERLAPAASQSLFYAIWVCKEAVLKAAGLGLSYPAARITVLAAAAGGAEPVRIEGHGDWWVSLIDAPAGYAAACACRRPFMPTLRTSSVIGSQPGPE